MTNPAPRDRGDQALLRAAKLHRGQFRLGVETLAAIPGAHRLR